MSLLMKLTRIPFLLWFLIAGGLGYMDYSEWESTVMSNLESELSSKQTELETAKREASKADEFRRRKEEKLRELQALSDKLEGTRQKYPTSPNIPQLLKDLADVADRTGLEFHSFKPAAERREEFVVITPIDVTLRGTYVQVMSFLDTSANLKRAVAAEKLELDANQQNQGNVQRDNAVTLINARASLVTYSIEDTNLSGAIPGAASANKSSGDKATTPPADKGH